ncbi:hypothetical protein LTR53_004332 [Teratosphaeriaceae sp. CCFEE 6253]|nr:hypothetical protein LTR53_004332 [Teratosphaeriaceae sp. CCFEE 6253]
MGAFAFFSSWFQPAISALSPSSHLSLQIRSRLLLLQTFVLLTYTPKYIYWLAHRLRHRDHKVVYIPTRSGHEVRTLVFGLRSHVLPGDPLRPLHLDIHGGAFLGGIAEYDAPLCAHLAAKTGAVVLSTDYRVPPAHPFPAAIEDVEDTILWLHAHARARLGADPGRLTVSGASAGGTLAFAAATKFHGTDRAMRRVVTLFAPVDLQVPPWEKRKPAGFPKFDVSLPLQPLFDLYASEARKSGYAKSPRLSPILADPSTLPDEVLMIVPTMDILLDEQLAFAERLRECEGKKVEVRLFEGQLHAFIDLPSFMIGATTRQEAFDAVASFVREERLDGM